MEFPGMLSCRRETDLPAIAYCKTLSTKAVTRPLSLLQRVEQRIESRP